MNRRTFLITPALAAAAQTASAAPASLFDGKTLAGWTIEQGPETAFYVKDGAITVHESAGYPAWLRSAREYENFDFRGEFFIKGWMDSGIYIHAPLHGRPTWEGIQLKLFHQLEETPATNSMGSLFPLMAPRKVNVKNRGNWNSFRMAMDWPRLRVWTNDELIQDVNLESDPNFRHRRRSGYLGFASLTYPIQFRNLSIEELPSKEKWQTLYGQPSDFDQWSVSEGKPHFEPIGEVLRGDGTGHIATKEQFRDFELRMYVRSVKEHNSGVLFRTSGEGLKGRHYEIQLHNVEDAHYPTGSLYHYKRSTYPRIEPEQWFPLHLIVKDANCIVRINGDTVLEYDHMDNLEPGKIELQAHRQGYWTEFKDIQIKRI
jgi:hypothetical protein